MYFHRIMLFIFSFLLLLSCIVVSSCTSNATKYAEDTLQETYGKIIYSSVIFRHGDRTPKTNYPTDPYPESIWGGFLQLTKKGKQQSYDLGKWYRKRYEELTGDQGYNYKLLLMNCTGSDRAFMSGETFLAGMFPPNEDEMWADDGLKWQPIPVHQTPESEDRMAGASAECERYDFEFAYWGSSPEAQEFYKQYQEVIEYTCENAGFPQCSMDRVFLTLKLIWTVYNALSIQDEHNLTLPAWTKKIYPEPTRTISQFYFSTKTYSLEMRRLKGGPLIQNIRSEMAQKRNGSLERLYHFYSAQETSLAVFLGALDMYNGIIPSYTASVMIELREKDSEYYVTFLYRNTTDLPPYLLQVPDCGDPCTLEKFFEVTDYLIPENWDEECKIGFLEKTNWKTIFSVSVTVVVLIIVGVLLTKLIYKKNSKSKLDYNSL